MNAKDLAKWERYFAARNNGEGVEPSARKAGLSASSAWRFERGDQKVQGLEAASILGVQIVAGNLVQQALSAEAQRALKDFAYFRRRYMGRESDPWQVRAAGEVLQAVQSKDREYIVMNEPPGSGKSTLFTHDIPCWIIANNRAIRIQIGSEVLRMAELYVGRIKKTLERDVPLRASSDDIMHKIAFNAEACMQDDFTAFKPPGRTDKWRSNELVVRQLDGVALDDKEATVSAWGEESGFLGGRFDLVIWDDLVTRKGQRTADAKQQLREFWDLDAETRLEPGGTMLLQGQRISHDDLYRYALDKRNLDETPKYRHVKYKAHDEDLCTGDHDNLKSWPESCLLSPYRLPWKMLETIAHNNPRSYAVTYQQEDGDVSSGLAERAWIEGGMDSKGFAAPGCLDRERGLYDFPPHLVETGWSYITADPSPTEWWGVIWWLYDPDTKRKYILDMQRRRWDPQDFLTLDLDTGIFSGYLIDTYQTSVQRGIPLSLIVFEQNAAQKWFLSQPHVQKWQQVTGVPIIGHTTHAVNKNAELFGLESIGDDFRQGYIRIPWGDIQSRGRCQYLIDEAIRYPDHDTTDLLMSTWFGKLAVEHHFTPRKFESYQMGRPSWVRARERGMQYA